MKAMILAAGQGMRMRPLTLTTPKPLIEVNRKPLIVHHIENLAKAGVTDIVINLSWLGKKIQNALGDGSQWDVTIRYSLEPDPLESGGGIYKALPLLGEQPFIVLNADIYTNFPMETLKKNLCPKLAHLIMINNPYFRPKGDFALLQKTSLLHPINCRCNLCIRDDILITTPLTFSGISMLRPELFQNCQSNKFSLTQLLIEAMPADHVTGSHFTGTWFDIGTPQRLQHVNLHLTQISKRQSSS